MRRRNEKNHFLVVEAYKQTLEFQLPHYLSQILNHLNSPVYKDLLLKCRLYEEVAFECYVRKHASHSKILSNSIKIKTWVSL